MNEMIIIVFRAFAKFHSIITDTDEDERPNDGGEDSPSEAGDARSSLMDAIRKAGGAGKAGLKKGKNKKNERKAKKEETESPADLLGDLSAALGRRRKALSGRDKSSGGDKGSAGDTGEGGMMDKISAMIPPPPPPGGGGDSDASEEDNNW